MSGVVKLGFDLFAATGTAVRSLYSDTSADSQVADFFYVPLDASTGYVEFKIGNGEIKTSDASWKSNSYFEANTDGYLIVKASENPSIDKDLWAEVDHLVMQKSNPGSGDIWRVRMHIRGLRYGLGTVLYDPFSS